MPRGRLLLSLALLAAPIAAAGAAAQSTATVTSTTFLISGRGWGHGVGMSQWGAYGYARRGVGYDKILAHYYPGTRLLQTPVQRIKVLLIEQAHRLDLSSSAAFRVKDGAGVVHELAAGSYTLGPKLALRLLPPKPARPLPGPLTFLPGKSPLWLARPWRGSFVVSSTGKRLSVVNTVSIESYVRGVVSSEMPRDWPLEAVKAQAVAARSYALAHRRGGWFDVYADTRDQVYGGILAETPVGDQAVADTKRQVLTYDGKIATTYFFSTSGGRTASAADVFVNAKPTPYLVSVPDPYDTASPYHTWGPLVFSAPILARRLHVDGLSDLRPVPATGRARTVLAIGQSGEDSLPAAEVRRALGLRSTWIEVGVLSLSRPAGKVVRGTPVTVTGRAEHVDDPVLEQRVGASDWQAGPSLKLQRDGSFSVTVTPAAPMQLRLVAEAIRTDGLPIAVAPP